MTTVRQRGRDCGADAAAYVLGSLERSEAEAFRAHLQTCAVCRDEVARSARSSMCFRSARRPSRCPGDCVAG